jgi:hypothetical protein
MAELGVLAHPVQKFCPNFGPIDSTLKLLPIIEHFRGRRPAAPELRGLPPLHLRHELRVAVRIADHFPHGVAVVVDE